MQGEKLQFSDYVAAAGALGAFVNVLILTWIAIKRFPSELKKLDVEGGVGESEEDLNTLEGAKISLEMLQLTIVKLQKDVDAEKENRKKDNEYFRRRIREMDRENREYRTWAARLVKQVINAGLIPIAFEPIQESDPSLEPVTDPKENK